MNNSNSSAGKQYLARMAGGVPPGGAAGNGDGCLIGCIWSFAAFIIILCCALPRQVIPFLVVAGIEYVVLRLIVNRAGNPLPEAFEDQSAVSYCDSNRYAADAVQTLSDYVSETRRIAAADELMLRVISHNCSSRDALQNNMNSLREELKYAEPCLACLTGIPSEAAYKEVLKNIKNVKGISTSGIVDLINSRLIEYGKKNDIYTKGVEYLTGGSPRLAMENFRILGSFKNSPDMLAAARNRAENADVNRLGEYQIGIVIIAGIVLLAAAYAVIFSLT